MSAEFSKKLFTVDDCYRMVEAGILCEDERIELIRGELIQMSPIGTRHMGIVDRLNKALSRLAGDDAIVRIQGTVVLNKFTAPQPDLALLRPREDFYIHKHPDASDIFLIIEVADSSRQYDTKVKSGLYATYGVHELWIADLQNEKVTCYTAPVRKRDSYRSVREFHRGDTIAPQLLPDCRLKVDLLLP